MTSKERVLAAIARKPTDRIPIQIYLTPEIQTKLMQHFGFTDPEELLRKFGVDFRNVNPVYGGAPPSVPEGSVFCRRMGGWLYYV